MPDTILLNAEEKMQKTIEVLKKEFAKLRTGRANPKMFEEVKVEYYGVPTPINQVCNVSVPEANQIYIKPYDRSILAGIEKAIFAANLGFTPANDGVGIRIVLPSMTEERRKETVKELKKQAEEGRIAVRNIRKDANADLHKLQKEKLISEDEEEVYLEEIQKITDKFIELIEKETSAKEADIMKI